MQISSEKYGKIVVSGAIYDLITTSAFATPWTFDVVHKYISLLYPLPSFEPMHVMFANLLGSIAVIWSFFRIRNPKPVLGLFDSISRTLCLTWELYYLIAMHGSPIVWYFAVFELWFVVAEGYGYWSLQKNPSSVAETNTEFSTAGSEG
jgi:hypothetical protein